MIADFSQYEIDVLKNLEQENLKNIIKFLSVESPNYLDDILHNYLDLFLINYEDFIKKYNRLKDKYGSHFLDLDLSLLEELYVI